MGRKKYNQFKSYDKNRPLAQDMYFSLNFQNDVKYVLLIRYRIRFQPIETSRLTHVAWKAVITRKK